MWLAEIFDRTWVRSKKCLRVLLFLPLQEASKLLWCWCPLWLSIKSFLLLSIESIQKSRILFEIIIWNSVGESSYIKSIVYADERQSLEDQCFPVTGNIKEFSFSIRKADHMDPASCLKQNPTFLALRNWVQGIILIPKTNPASLTSGCFYLSSTFKIHWLTDLLVSRLSSQGTQEVSSEGSPCTTFSPRWSKGVAILSAGKAHSCTPPTPTKICLF